MGQCAVSAGNQKGNKMRKLILSTTAVFALAAATTATPAAAGGFRVDLHGGWDEVSIDGIGDKSGVQYGIGWGYDFDVTKNFFIGPDGNIDLSSTKLCAFDVQVAGDKLCAKTGTDMSPGVRMGFNVGEASKLYMVAAYTRAKARVVYDDGITETKLGDWADGWRLGAGYQLTFSNGVYGKLEYRYSDYQGGFKRHNIIAGVGYQF